MGLSLLMMLTSPVTWLLVAAAASAWRRGRGKKMAVREHRAAGTQVEAAVAARHSGAVRGAAIDAGAAFMFFSVAYRPEHAFMVKAQIRQVEDVDEDDEGGKETPIRHLDRQLRRIRRGEEVKHLVWRLE